MAQEDYLMRMLRQFVSVLLHIRTLRATRQEQAALDAIRQAAGHLLALPPDVALHLSLPELLAYRPALTVGPAPRETQIALATLLYEAGTLYTTQQRAAEAYPCYLQALSRLLEVGLQQPAPPFPPETPSIAALTTALASYRLPQETNARLLQYYEQVGAYAQAEDVLYALLADAPDDPTLRALGRAFYQRLLRQPDACLIAGNLPRDEVQEGLARLQD